MIPEEISCVSSYCKCLHCNFLSSLLDGVANLQNDHPGPSSELPCKCTVDNKVLVLLQPPTSCAFLTLQLPLIPQTQPQFSLPTMAGEVHVCLLYLIRESLLLSWGEATFVSDCWDVNLPSFCRQLVAVGQFASSIYHHPDIYHSRAGSLCTEVPQGGQVYPTTVAFLTTTLQDHCCTPATFQPAARATVRISSICWKKSDIWNSKGPSPN